MTAQDTTTASTLDAAQALDPRALVALRDNQRQLDQDGVEVGVSRQALDETLAHLAALQRQLDKARAKYDTLWSNYMALEIAITHEIEQREAAELALSARDAEPNTIPLTPAEIQSGLDRVRWAELLIRQLPDKHEGRNSWLLNYGIGSSPPEPNRQPIWTAPEAARDAPQAQADERDAFEEWALKDFRELTPLEFEERTPGNNQYYESDANNEAYIGWTARAVLTRPSTTVVQKTQPSGNSTTEAKPDADAAMFTNYLGCEIVSTDVASIERAAAAATNGPMPVTIALIAIDRFAKATDGVPFDGDGGNEE